MTIATSTKLGRYEIRSKIGEGGMGDVYLARDHRWVVTLPLRFCLQAMEELLAEE